MPLEDIDGNEEGILYFHFPLSSRNLFQWVEFETSLIFFPFTTATLFAEVHS